MRAGYTAMQPREFSKRWINSRERLFNPEEPPNFQWPDIPEPDHGANWDFLKALGAGVAVGLALVAAMTIWLAAGSVLGSIW